MNAATLDLASAFIRSRAEWEDLPPIEEVLKLRQSFLWKVRSASISVGDTIEITDMRPKYYNGLVGIVESIASSASIRLDPASSARIYKESRHRMGGKDETAYLLTGIPLTGCAPYVQQQGAADAQGDEAQVPVDPAELAALTVADVLGCIRGQAADRDIDRFIADVNDRRPVLRAQFAAVVEVGQTITIADVKNKYLLDLTGTVKLVTGSGLTGKANVLLSEESTAVARRLGVEIRPGITRCEVRIPLCSCRVTA